MAVNYVLMLTGEQRRCCVLEVQATGAPPWVIIAEAAEQIMKNLTGRI